MKVSETWLRSLIDLPLDLSQLVQQLTQSGIEVDAVEESNFDGSGGSKSSASSSHSGSSGSSRSKILTLKIPPTRGDCLSMEGLCRELAALNGLPFKPIAVERLATSSLPRDKSHDQPFSVKIEERDACKHYCGQVLLGLNPKALTPEWMQNRLKEAGFKTHSLIVDITNYVMLELGQPLHAFDLAKLDQGLFIRKAKAGEILLSLENKELHLTKEHLIIADRKGPQALAGVIGGLQSSVSDTTTQIFLESAYFDPIHIRLASQAFHIQSESSYRFARGVDPNLQLRALNRATQLILEIAGGSAGAFIELPESYQFLSSNILLRQDRIAKILGVSPKESEIKDILERLQMEIKKHAQGFEVRPPSFRSDVVLEIDIIEEIARVYGYARIPSSLPKAELNSPAIFEVSQYQDKIRQVLVNRGYHETITYSFISEAEQLLFSEKEANENVNVNVNANANVNDFNLKLSNPLSPDWACMRASILPGLIKVLQYNQHRQQTRLRLFELGTVFQQSDLENESLHLTGVVFGPRFKEQWGIVTKDLDFYDVKGDIEALLSFSKIDAQFVAETSLEKAFEMGGHPALNPRQAAYIKVGSETIGFLGALHPKIVAKLELKTPIYVFDLNLKALNKMPNLQFKELSKFPTIRRDIAIIVDRTVLAQDLKSAIVNSVGLLLRDISIFDVYQGKGIEPGKKSIALSILLQHPSRTLTEMEATEVLDKVIQTLKQQYQAILRE